MLNVGQKKPHRNQLRLIQAMVDGARDVPAPNSSCPARPTRRPGGAARPGRDLGLDGAVTVPGFLATADLEGLYARPAFLFPSLVEGFGLPVLEAMARGLPVACTRGSAPRGRRRSGLALDPTSEDSIAQATLAVLTDDALRARLVGGRSRPRRFLHVGALRRRDACGLRAGARAGLVSAPVSGGAITQPDVPDPPIGDVLDTPEASRAASCAAGRCASAASLPG